MISATGPRPARIAIVGEAPGASEEQLGVPFVGASGKELTRMLEEAGISRDECFLTNVFMTRPKDNKIEEFFVSKKEGVNTLPPLRPGKYLRPELLPELSRLREELLLAKPNVIIALGATASWALLKNSKISNIRGVVTMSDLGIKVLPTFHPAAILRQWDLRAIAVMDLFKAKNEAVFPHVERLRREMWIEPNLGDLVEFERRYLLNASHIAVDIETKFHTQITCIGFASDQTHAIVVPFLDERKKDWNYWPTDVQESAAWNWCRGILGNKIPKTLQNGLYDLQYIWRKMRTPVRGLREDTMISHHALYPELQKSLGFLGSVYCNEAAWKGMRKEKDEEKADD